MYTLLSDFYVNFIVTGLLVIGNIPLKRSIIFYSRIFSAYSLSNFDSIHGSTCDSACVTCTLATWINSCHICCELLITYDSYRRRSTAFNTTEQCILSVKSGNSFSEVKNGQDEQRGNPDWYMFTGENYIVRTDDTASEIGDIDASDQGYDFTIDPGEYRIVSGWEKVALEIRSSSGKDETVKFDEADHEEKIELHAGDEVSVVSLDGQDNYLAMYQIQQYDE